MAVNYLFPAKLANFLPINHLINPPKPLSNFLPFKPLKKIKHPTHKAGVGCFKILG